MKRLDSRSLVRLGAASMTAAILASTAFGLGEGGCPCTGDADANGVVDGADLAIVLGAWGPCASCVADLDDNGIVDGADLAIVLGGWGLCTDPPPNDACADATLVVGFSGSSNPFCTIGATTDGPSFGGNPCGTPSFNSIDNDVWYTIIAPTTATLQISVCADFPVRLAVYGPNSQGNCGCTDGAPSELLGPLVACGAPQTFPACALGALTLVPVEAGDCLRVRIGGAAGAQGKGNLDINVYAPPCSLESSTTLPAAGLEAASSFGLRSAISGNVAAVGAIFDDLLPVSNCGSVRVYDHNGTTWTPVATLFSPAPFGSERLGIALAMSGNWIAAGAGDASAGCTADPDCSTGAVHIYRKQLGNWSHSQKLVSDGLSPMDHFGSRVEMQGTRLLVGAYDDTNANGERAGAVYAYQLVTIGSFNIWAFAGKLVASDGDDFDRFGMSVAIHGQWALIGADSDEGGGSAYLFFDGPDGWEEVQKLQPSAPPPGAKFGASVAILDGRALVGAPATASTPGAVHAFQLFEPFGWLAAGVLSASDGQNGDRFGQSISMSEDHAIISSAFDNDAQGSAYVFRRFGSEWLERAILTAADGAAGHAFGNSAFGSGRALIGAYNNGPGVVYSFTGIADCNGNGILDACDIATGTPDANGNGVPDICE